MNLIRFWFYIKLSTNPIIHMRKYFTASKIATPNISLLYFDFNSDILASLQHEQALKKEKR